MPGPRVRHPRWGDGVVIGDPAVPRPTVDFGYMKETVSRKNLSWRDRPKNDAAAQRNERAAEPAEEASALPEEAVRARRAILALKLGQVLEEDVEQLSVGIEAVQARLQQAVAAATRRRPQSVLIEGAWGTGKTHLLTLLTSLARKQGFCTAHVILDGEGVTLSEPMGLMEGILSSLRYPGEAIPSGIGDRLRQSRRQHDYRELRRRLGCRLAQAMRQLPAAALDNPEALEVLEDYLMLTLAKTRAQEKLRYFGYAVDLPTVKAWRIAERPDRFREHLSSWAEFCVLTGAAGLVVVFDEVDVEYAAHCGTGRGSGGERRFFKR